MNYYYEFDKTYADDLRLQRSSYGTLQDAYRKLRDELGTWNLRACDHGASTPPYKREIEDLDRKLKWGDEQLAHANAQEIVVKGISVGSLRYAKAALTLMMYRRREDLMVKSNQHWPYATLRSLNDSIERISEIADIFEHEPSDVLWELIPKVNPSESSILTLPANQWDAFISHASEDKEVIVRPLARALQARGVSVWFDEFTLTVGDSLRRSIDRGLALSRFGVVVISPHFLLKEWPQRELDGLAAREVGGSKVILPVWHNITAEELRTLSPMLADRIATLSSNGINRVVDDLTQAITAGVATTTAG